MWLLLSDAISRRCTLPLSCLTSDFSYRNRVVTSRPAVITAVSSNQLHNTQIKPSERAGRGDRLLEERGHLISVCVCVCYIHVYASILVGTEGILMPFAS